MAITRVADTDDDGTGLTGTPHNAAWLQQKYDEFDGRWSTYVITDTGTKDNYSITSGGLEADTLIFNNSSLLTLRGIVAPASPAKPGKPIRLVSKGGGQVDLLNENTNSTAANRINTHLSGDPLSLAAGWGRALLIYDDSVSRWRVLLHDQGKSISYTSTWGVVSSGTNTIGGGSVTAKYYVEGLRCWYQIKLLWGSGTSSTADAWTFSLPFTTDGFGPFGGSVVSYDSSGAASYMGEVLTSSSTVLLPTYISSSSGLLAQVTPTTPFTWATNDAVLIKGWFWLA